MNTKQAEIKFFNGAKLPLTRNLQGEYVPLNEALALIGVPNENTDAVRALAEEILTRLKYKNDPLIRELISGRGWNRKFNYFIRIDAFRRLLECPRLPAFIPSENRHIFVARREELNGRLFEYWFGRYGRSGNQRGTLTTNTKYYRRRFTQKAA